MNKGIGHTMTKRFLRRRNGLVRSVAVVTLAIFGVACANAVLAANRPSSAVSHAAPEVTPPKEMQFSFPPQDSEFLRTGLFAEPLAPVATTSDDENGALASALLAYRDAGKEGGVDAVEPLLVFLQSHPNSPWTPALKLNLGIIYRQTGHFSKALDAWQSGWQDSQDLSDREGRALANAIVARLSQLEQLGYRKTGWPPALVV